MKVLLLLAVAAAALAQDPSIRVDVSLVNVAFTARDAKGNLVSGLTKDDIEVLEDGVPQQVRFFGRSEDLPLRVGIVVDFSGSQGRFVRQHQLDIDDFLSSALGDRDRALLVMFDTHIRLVSDFVPPGAAMMSGLGRPLKDLHKLPELAPDHTRDNASPVFDAVWATAWHKMREVEGARKAIILFSDGEDNASAHDLMDAIEAAQSADTPIYTVRYTSVAHGSLSAHNRYGITEMNRFAEQTGGMAFDATTADVKPALRRIAEELRSMYEVGFMTGNPNRDGAFRKITIRAKKPGIVIRAKPGYFAH